MSKSATASDTTRRQIRSKWFLGLGVTLLVLGIVGASIGVANLLQITSTVVIGPIVLVSSLAQLVFSAFAEERKERLLHFVAASLEAILGFAIMANPPERIGGLVTLVAVVLLMIGLVRFARSFVVQSRRRAWIVFTGVVAILLGASIWFVGPVAKLGFVALCIAIDFVCHGVVWSLLAKMEGKSGLESDAASEKEAPLNQKAVV